MKFSIAKDTIRTVIAAALCAVLLISCGGDSVRYCRLVYEASSEPSANLSVKMQYPGKDAMYGTSGASVRQDCGYVPEGYEASVIAEVIRMTGMFVPDNVTVTVRILLDNVCVAENSGSDSAAISYTVKSNKSN